MRDRDRRRYMAELYQMKIEVKNYGGKVTRRLELPERGLILVSACNGLGKSAMLADAPLLAMFGETGSRGDPLRAGGEVDFELGDLRVVRSRGKAGQPVRVALTLSGKAVDCDTATKADAYMVERYGPADLWADLLVWRHDNPSAYSCGTDSERKRLTELLVPTLAGFDAGLERCADRRKMHAKGPLAQSAAAVSAAEQAAELADQELNRVLALPDTADDPVTLRAEADKLGLRGFAIARRMRVLEDSLRAGPPNPELAVLEQQARDASHTEQMAAADLARVWADRCPTCGQSMGDEATHRETKTRMQAVLTDASDKRRELRIEVDALRATLLRDQRVREVEARAELDTLSQRYQDTTAAAATLRTRADRAEERARLGATEAQARERAQLAWDKKGEALAAWSAQDEEREALELAERMLGPRGARAGLLDRAFRVVEQLAAAKLARAWPGSRLKIARTTETSKGKVNEVTRVLGTRPVRPGEEPEEMAEVGRYSTGQLRRVDLALLLARRQVLAASDRNRLALPYLVIDEALNGLDDEGLTGCAELLVEEAKDNLVIVLSHDEKMSRGIPFDRHIQLGASQ